MSENTTVTKKKYKFFNRDNILWVLLIGFLMIALGGDLLGNFLVYVGLESMLAAWAPGFQDSGVWQAAQIYLGFTGIWIVALIILSVFRGNRPILKALGTKTRGNTPKMFAVGLAIGLGMNLFCGMVAMLNGDISISFVGFQPLPMLFLFVAVLIQSAAEELICRVFIYQRLMRRFGKPVLATVINAAFFAVIHLGNPGVTGLAILNIFIYGLVFSAMVVYMDSPWAAMAAHAAWNFCQNMILGLPNSGIVSAYSIFKLDAAAAVDSFAYSTSFGLEGTITACAVLLAACAVIVWWGRKHKIVPTDIWNTAV